MPQISPLSWLLIPFSFLTFLFLVMVGIWWVFLGGYDFSGLSKDSGVLGVGDNSRNFEGFFWTW